METSTEAKRISDQFKLLGDYFRLTRNAIGIFASLRIVSCRDETQCVGKVHNVSSTQSVAAFDFLKENLDGGC